MTPTELSERGKRCIQNSPWRRTNGCQTQKAIASAKRIRENERKRRQ